MWLCERRAEELVWYRSGDTVEENKFRSKYKEITVSIQLTGKTTGRLRFQSLSSDNAIVQQVIQTLSLQVSDPYRDSNDESTIVNIKDDEGGQGLYQWVLSFFDRTELKETKLEVIHDRFLNAVAAWNAVKNSSNLPNFVTLCTIIIVD